MALRSENFYFARTVQYLFVSSVVDVEVLKYVLVKFNGDQEPHKTLYPSFPVSLAQRRTLTVKCRSSP